MKIFLEGYDAAPTDRTLFTDGCICAALERTYLCAELKKTKEELLGPATTDDKEDDEICDLIDTFRYFTVKPSKENPLDQASWGTDMELNERIRAEVRKSLSQRTLKSLIPQKR